MAEADRCGRDTGRGRGAVQGATKRRKAGFLDFQSTPDAFTGLFERLERLDAERIIPKR